MTRQELLIQLHRLHGVFLGLAKWVGLFAFCERLYRGRLPILCYHGFGSAEDSSFRDIFMTESGFEQRLRWLKENGYCVLPLEQAVNLLNSGELPPRSVVITIDDGFASTNQVAAPLLNRYGFPATIYVTTYYVKHSQHPIFRLAIQYLFWKTKAKTFPLGKFLPGGPESISVLGREGELGMWQLIEYGETELGEEQRFHLFLRVATALQVDTRELLAKKTLHLATPESISELARQGFDIQLHTHRHILPDSMEELQRELEENRNALEPLVGKKLHHFCYPSGLWTEAQRDMLESLGIQTATTCDERLNGPQSDPLSLGRYCDSDRIPLIEFEAELVGFNQLNRLNPIKRAVRKLLGL